MKTIIDDNRVLMSQADFIRCFEYPQQTVNSAFKDGRLDSAKVEWKGRKVPLLDIGKAVSCLEDGGDFSKWRTLREKELAEKLRLANERTRAEWLPRADVEEIWYETTRRSRNHALMLPDRVAAVLTTMNDVVEIKALLVKEIDKMLEDECNEIRGMLSEDE